MRQEILVGINDNTDSLIRYFKSPRSVAAAYRQYIIDKTAITTKILSAVAEAVSSHEEGIMRTSNEVENILQNAGIDLRKPIITSNGDFITAETLIEKILNEGMEIGSHVQGAVYGKQVDIGDTVDMLVDSYQSSKVFESAFSVMEVTAETAYTSFADMQSRMTSLGMELTDGALGVMTQIGDAMSDRSSDLISKIAQIAGILTGGDRAYQQSTDQGISLPEFDQNAYSGSSPMNIFINSIDIDISSPISAITTGVKKGISAISNFFKKTSKVVAKGWDKVTDYFEDTFVDPIDFIKSNTKSTSHMLDVPFIYRKVTRQSMTAGGFSDPIIMSRVLDMFNMEDGQMRSVYTPYALINFVKQGDDIQIIGHLIPTQPLQWYGEEIRVPTYYWDDAEGIADQNEHIMPYEPQEFFDMYILDDQRVHLDKDEPDDYYHIQAVCASMIRFNSLVFMLRPVLLNAMLPASPEGATATNFADVIENFTQRGLYSGLWQVMEEGDDHRWFRPETRANFTYKWMEPYDHGHTPTVTNLDFMNVLKDDPYIPDKNFGILFLLAYMNDYDYMEAYANKELSVPAFMPSIMENEYQDVMYEIVTDSAHGDKVEKFFKGIAIAVGAAVAAVVVVKVALIVKFKMGSSVLALAGQKRVVEDMDPSDPGYRAAYNALRKSTRSFEKKNKFLGYLGLGVKNSASKAMNSDFDLPFLSGNDDLIKIISGK